MREKCDHKERQNSDKRDFDREFEEYIIDFYDLDYTYYLEFILMNEKINNTYSDNDIENDLLGIGGDLSKFAISKYDMGRLRRYWNEM